MSDYQILTGNVLETLKGIESNSVQLSVSSPPYLGLRDYGTGKWIGGDPNCSHKRDSKQSKTTSTGQKNLEGAIGDGIFKDVCKTCGAKRVDEQIGLEVTPELYIEKLVMVYREVWRVLKDDGIIFINIGDSYWGSNGNGWEQTLEKKNKKSKGENNLLKESSNRKSSIYKPKDLIGIPWMLAFALRADGWFLRMDIIWNKPNPMPESVKDRPTKSHEYIFMLSKSKNYYYDYQAILEPAEYDGRKAINKKGGGKYDGEFMPSGMNAQSLAKKDVPRWSNKIAGRTERKMENTGYAGDGSGLQGHSGYFDANGNPRVHTKKNDKNEEIFARNKRSVWSVATKPYEGAHFATYPEELIEPCILAGSRAGDIVLDPFSGSGTTGAVALTHHRKYIGCELNPDYVKLSHKRLSKVNPVLFGLERINV